MKKIIILFCAIFCTNVLFAQGISLEDQLVKASYNGDLQTVQALLSNSDIDVNARYNGFTALINACLKGHLDIVKELLSHKDIDVNKREIGHKRTPLIIASMINHTDIVTELLKHSPKLNKQDISGYTALMYAAKNGNMDVAKALLAQDDIKVNVYTKWRYENVEDDPNGPTALLIAYNTGHRDIAMEILKVKPYIGLREVLTEVSHYYNAYNSDENTILLLAAKDGDIEMVKYLFKLEDDRSLFRRAHSPLVIVNHMNKYDDTALILAARNGHLDVVQELLKRDDLIFTTMKNQGLRAYQEAATQEIKDIIAAKYKNPSKRIAEILENKILTGFEHLQCLEDNIK